MKRKLILLTICLVVMPAAHASSSEAWAADAKAMKKACLKASQLKNSMAEGEIMMFDDRVGYSALVISGRYPQAHMNNKRGRELCLWRRDAQKAYITEADTLLRIKR